MERITPEQFSVAEGCDDWRYALGAIRASFRAPSLAEMAGVVTNLVQLGRDAPGELDIDMRSPDRLVVVIRPVEGLTNDHVALARTISDAASRAGLVSEPDGVQAIEFAIDTMDADRIRPFWAAVLDYRDEGGVLVDPRRAGPPLWFQQMDEARPGRGRFHVDVSVPHDQAGSRIEAALDAGGRMVTAAFARSWWVLADADGNEVCVCTWQDRSLTST